jgi:hypothetical protein
VNRLEFILSQKDQFIELQNFRIETAINQINGEAGFATEQQTGNADFEIPELKLSEFSYFLPYLKFPATPNINLKAGMEENTSRATIQLEDQNQLIELQASSANLAEFPFQFPGNNSFLYIGWKIFRCGSYSLAGNAGSALHTERKP